MNPGTGSWPVGAALSDDMEQIKDLVESVADLNEALEEHRASVQEITIGNDRVVVVGTQAGTDLISAQDLLEGLRESAEEAIDAVQPPAERLGPGVVNSTSAGSGPFYVALGDSLAANVGVSEPRDGYVARFHNQLQIRDGQEYGLRNFGISGETTGTLIRSGQLDDAIAFMNDNEVAYVTIDIGANNLLGHLGSPDCSESLEEVACQQRLASTFDSYDDDLALILDEIQDAAPDATVMFVLAYNPFSLGFAAVGLEEQSDAILRQFNSIAVAEAESRGFIVADTQTPMEGTTAATTHMVDPEPDIHPYPIGFDIMASAMVDALP